MFHPNNSNTAYVPRDIDRFMIGRFDRNRGNENSEILDFKIFTKRLGDKSKELQQIFVYKSIYQLTDEEIMIKLKICSKRFWKLTNKIRLELASYLGV